MVLQVSEVRGFPLGGDEVRAEQRQGILPFAIAVRPSSELQLFSRQRRGESASVVPPPR